MDKLGLGPGSLVLKWLQGPMGLFNCPFPYTWPTIVTCVSIHASYFHYWIPSDSESRGTWALEMAFLALFVSATKFAGVLVTLSVAANAFSFSRYRRKNLQPFRSPIDESSETLAVFNVDPSTGKPNHQTLILMFIKSIP